MRGAQQQPQLLLLSLQPQPQPQPQPMPLPPQPKRMMIRMMSQMLLLQLLQNIIGSFPRAEKVGGTGTLRGG